MRRSLALLLAVIPTLAAPEAAAEAPFSKPVISIVESAGHADLTIELTPIEGTAYPTGDVPFTAEPYSIIVLPAARTQEYDLFGSGLAMDLDGDRKTNGVIPLECFAGGVLQVGGTPVRPFVEAMVPGTWQGNYLNPDGSSRVARVGKKGAWFAVYTPCRPERPTSVGLSPPGKKMKVHHVPGPALQLLVLEELFVPTKAPTVKISKLKLDGRPQPSAFAATSHAYEPVFDARALWHGVEWRMVSLGKTPKPHTLTARLTATGETRRRMVVVILNTSPAPGIRERAAFASEPVNL